jgi:hypothetical protein
MSNAGLPEIPWVDASRNPWGVPVLDVRPVTQHMLSTSQDPKCAENAISFRGDDGTGFIGEEPPEGRAVAASLRFRIDRMLADGVLFSPSEMEHKWAIFYHRRQILCVRSWLRRVHVIGEVEERGDHVEITTIRGAFSDREEDPAWTARMMDYLLRSHALDIVHPVPLPPGMEANPGSAARWCMSISGKLALVATPHALPASVPERPLRSHSLLHIAVAKGDLAAVDAQLRSGVPIDLVAGDGLAPLHWALAAEGAGMIDALLDRGSPVDARSAEGATPLMNAVQARSLSMVMLLLERGADPDARDGRGFTALHRAAEMGEADIVRALLERGADPAPEAHGHTPRSLAEARGETAIVDLLRG